MFLDIDALVWIFQTKTKHRLNTQPSSLDNLLISFVHMEYKHRGCRSKLKQVLKL